MNTAQKLAPHDEIFPNRRPDELEQQAIDKGYKFLGWQVYGEPLAHCIKEGHNRTNKPQGWKVKQNNPRGSDVTYVCDMDKLFWKIDMSD